MSELNNPIPSKDEVNDLLNPDFMSGRQIAAFKKLDESNLDIEDFAELLQAAMDAYLKARTDD